MNHSPSEWFSLYKNVPQIALRDVLLFRLLAHDLREGFHLRLGHPLGLRSLVGSFLSSGQQFAVELGLDLLGEFHFAIGDIAVYCRMW